jgi:hypothetical protein
MTRSLLFKIDKGDALFLVRVSPLLAFFAFFKKIFLISNIRICEHLRAFERKRELWFSKSNYRKKSFKKALTFHNACDIINKLEKRLV